MLGVFLHGGHAGVLLAFDETVCGYRLEYGGGHRYFDIEPDLVTYGKIIGHGLPIGALCGRADVLAAYGSSPDQGPEVFGAVGTFNGPLCAKR
jgi:glutamate-1-semialdehyde 2,1-aminomutase